MGVGQRDGCCSPERRLAYARGMTSLRHYAAEYVYQMSVAAYLTLPMLVRDFSRNALRSHSRSCVFVGACATWTGRSSKCWRESVRSFLRH